MFRRICIRWIGLGVLVASSELVTAQEPQPATTLPSNLLTARTVLGVGEVTGDNVYVRSGPSLNHYTICKLKAGEKVTVVAEKAEWLEIQPPPGVFSLVSGDFVDSADDKNGTVNAENVRVRAGSLLNDDKYTVQTLLPKGTTVKVLGRNPDGFVRIDPPAAATLWINRSFVSLDAGAGSPTGVATEMKPVADSATVETKTMPSVEATKPTIREDAGPATALASPMGSGRNNDPLALLSTLDADARSELKKPVAERNLSPIRERYRVFARQSGDESTRRYAEIRVEQLTHLTELGSSVQGLSHFNAEAEAKRREFLEGRIKIRETLPPIPSALDIQGELRPSALFPPGGFPQRYRLVDPNAPQEKTIGYVEIPAGSTLDVTNFLGRYVGVRATARRLQTGGVDPVPVYVAGELVLLNPSGSDGGTVDE